MKTASEIAEQALREGNLIALGQPITAAQEAEAIDLLNRFIDSLLGFEIGEFAMDWATPPSQTSPVPARYPIRPRSTELPSDVWPYPPGNVRIVLKLVADTTIYMPQDPDDGARFLFINIGDADTHNLTVDGNGRLVKGGATVVDTPGNLNQQLWLYRADLSDWTLVTELSAADTSPLPGFYDDLLIIGTFIRLAARYGRDTSSESAAAFARLMKRLKTQYRQTVPQPSSRPNAFYLPASDQNRNRYGSFGSNLF